MMNKILDFDFEYDYYMERWKADISFDEKFAEPPSKTKSRKVQQRNTRSDEKFDGKVRNSPPIRRYAAPSNLSFTNAKKR